MSNAGTPLAPVKGAPVLKMAEFWALLKRGFHLRRATIPDTAAASAEPAYYIEMGGHFYRPVSSQMAATAINSGRLGHSMKHPDGGEFWMQTTRTP